MGATKYAYEVVYVYIPSWLEKCHFEQENGECTSYSIGMHVFLFFLVSLFYFLYFSLLRQEIDLTKSRNKFYNLDQHIYVRFEYIYIY